MTFHPSASVRLAFFSPCGVRLLNMSHHVKRPPWKRRSDAIGHLSDQLLTLLTETKRDEHGMGDQQRKDDAKQNIQRATASDKEYAGIARTFCRKRRLERYGISC